MYVNLQIPKIRTMKPEFFLDTATDIDEAKDSQPYQRKLRQPIKLAVVEDWDGFRKQQSSDIIRYRKYGNRYCHRSCNTYLNEKINLIEHDQILRNLLNQNFNIQDQQPSQPVLLNQQKNLQNSVYYRKLQRYYDFSQICFKCSKYGHNQNFCMASSKCLYCLSSQHITQQCQQQSICFVCRQFGHINKRCPKKQLQKGKQVGKKYQLKNSQKLCKNQNIRCLICLCFEHQTGFHNDFQQINS